MKIEQEEIRDLIVAVLTEAVTINSQSIDNALCLPWPCMGMETHKNPEIALSRTGRADHQVIYGSTSGLSLINACLDRMGIDAIVPVRDPQGFIAGFVDMSKVSTRSGYVPESATPSGSIGLGEGWITPRRPSSQVAAFRYNPGAKELDVKFQRGGIYTYIDATQEIFDGLAAADSTGSYINQVVKKACTFRKWPE